jgi:hypothetical protein
MIWPRAGAFDGTVISWPSSLLPAGEEIAVNAVGAPEVQAVGDMVAQIIVFGNGEILAANRSRPHEAVDHRIG